MTDESFIYRLIFFIVLSLFLAWLFLRYTARPTARGRVETEVEEADDLTAIEGIGSRTAVVLFRAGIESYDDLADTSPTRLRRILRDAGSRYKAYDPETWPKQAMLAAEGDWERLEKLQARIRRDRD